MSSIIRRDSRIDIDGNHSLVIPVPRFEPATPIPDSVEEAQTLAATLVREAQAEALALVEAAKREAGELLENTRRESKQVLEGARVQGLNQGREEAQKEYQVLRDHLAREHEVAMMEVTNLATSIQVEREQVVRNAIQPLPGICMDVMRDILRRELELAPANIEGMVQDLLQYVLDSVRVEVRVNPADYALAQAAHPIWRGVRYGDWELVVIPDSSVAIGGCLLRSDVGTINATTDVKLDLLQEAIDKAFAGGEVEQVGSVSDVTHMG